MAISKEEQARREHNHIVRENYKQNRKEVDEVHSYIKGSKKGLETEISRKILKQSIHIDQ